MLSPSLWPAEVSLLVELVGFYLSANDKIPCGTPSFSQGHWVMGWKPHPHMASQATAERLLLFDQAELSRTLLPPSTFCPTLMPVDRTCTRMCVRARARTHTHTC